MTGGASANQKGGDRMRRRPAAPRWAVVLAVAVLVAGGGAPRALAVAAGPAALPALTPLVTLRMFTPTTGWAATAQAVLRTTDGGTAWRQVGPRAAGVAPFFLSAAAAWVASPEGGGAGVQVWRTTDGGTSWTVATLNVPASALSLSLDFVNATDGWLLTGAASSSGPASATLWRTTNGGATWSAIYPAGQAASAAAWPFGGSGAAIGFRGALSGWAVVHPADPGAPWLYRTGDGGRTWLPPARLPTTPAARGAQVVTGLAPTFFGPLDGILPVRLRPRGAAGTGGQALWVFYRTHDGGTTWVPGAPVPAQAFIFLDPAHGFATVGPDLAATADGGRTWRQVPAHPPLGDIRVLDFVSPALGWAVQRDRAQGGWQLLHTADGGRTWSPLPYGLEVETAGSVEAGPPRWAGHAFEGAVVLGLAAFVIWVERRSRAHR